MAKERAQEKTKEAAQSLSCAEIDPEECPYYLITRVSLGATAALKRGFAEAGIGFVRPAYLGSLMSLWREDGLKVIDLGRRAGLEPSTMTGLLDRMERDGLVERRADAADRRVLKIFLTATGASIRESVIRIVDSTLAGLLSGVDASEIDTLKGLLHKVLVNVREEKVEDG